MITALVYTALNGFAFNVVLPLFYLLITLGILGRYFLRKLKNYVPTKFMDKDSHYDKAAADYAVRFIECLCHTKGTWSGKPFELIDWQEQIIRDIFGTIKD